MQGLIHGTPLGNGFGEWNRECEIVVTVHGQSRGQTHFHGQTIIQRVLVPFEAEVVSP